MKCIFCGFPVKVEQMPFLDFDNEERIHNAVIQCRTCGTYIGREYRTGFERDDEEAMQLVEEHFYNRVMKGCKDDKANNV